MERQLRSEWQNVAAMAEQMYPDPDDWDSDCETLVDPASGEDEDVSSTGADAVVQATTNDDYTRWSDVASCRSSNGSRIP